MGQWLNGSDVLKNQSIYPPYLEGMDPEGAAEGTIQVLFDLDSGHVFWI